MTVVSAPPKPSIACTATADVAVAAFRVNLLSTVTQAHGSRVILGISRRSTHRRAALSKGFLTHQSPSPDSLFRKSFFRARIQRAATTGRSFIAPSGRGTETGFFQEEPLPLFPLPSLLLLPVTMRRAPRATYALSLLHEIIDASFKVRHGTQPNLCKEARLHERRGRIPAE